MGSATLNLSVVEKRMVNVSEAASYSGLAAKHFKALCPVAPVAIRPGATLYDKRDLDRWIDGLKDGSAAATTDDILGRLA